MTDTATLETKTDAPQTGAAEATPAAAEGARPEGRGPMRGRRGQGGGGPFLTDLHLALALRPWKTALIHPLPHRRLRENLPYCTLTNASWNIEKRGSANKRDRSSSASPLLTNRPM